MSLFVGAFDFRHSSDVLYYLDIITHYLSIERRSLGILSV
jgi:hypothetical protein